MPEVTSLTLKGEQCRRCNWRGALSRNKVAVPEGVAGSPPFFLKIQVVIRKTYVALFLPVILMGL